MLDEILAVRSRFYCVIITDWCSAPKLNAVTALAANFRVDL